jgi:hypothetical protein
VYLSMRVLAWLVWPGFCLQLYSSVYEFQLFCVVASLFRISSPDLCCRLCLRSRVCVVSRTSFAVLRTFFFSRGHEPPPTGRRCDLRVTADSFHSSPSSPVSQPGCQQLSTAAECRRLRGHMLRFAQLQSNQAMDTKLRRLVSKSKRLSLKFSCEDRFSYPSERKRVH